MNRLLSLPLLLALCCSAAGQSVTLPKSPLVTKPNRPIFISPTVDGDDLKWEIPAGLDDWVSMLPPEFQKNFGHTKIFYGEIGTYTIRARTAKVIDGKAKISEDAVLVIIVTDKPIDPDDPPKPPPIDTFAIAIATAYRQTPDNESRERLTRFYRAAVTDINDAKLATRRQLRDRLDTSMVALLARDKLATVRRIVWDEVLKQIGGDEQQPLTAANRAAMASVFESAAKALEGL